MRPYREATIGGYRPALQEKAYVDNPGGMFLVVESVISECGGEIPVYFAKVSLSMAGGYPTNEKVTRRVSSRGLTRMALYSHPGAACRRRAS